MFHLIPFNKPVWLGSEIDRIIEAITENGHVAGGGPFSKRCEAILEAQLGQRTLLVSSCTHALEMAALLLEIAPGDEVIVPSYTFVSTATAFALRGAEVVFVDVDEDGNIDVRDVERALGPRTRAVVAVHYAGNSCDLEALLALCGRVPVVEDAAQALGASHRGRPLGTWGSVGAFSFHETKNVGCGEGGALTIRDERLVERAEYLRDKGTNRRKFLSGLVDKYTWVDVGSSYVLSDLNAAYLSEQLAHRERIQERRKALHDRYTRELSGAAERAGVDILRTRRSNEPNHHLFALVFRQGEQRERFIAHMKAHGILTPFHYVALHLSPKGRQYASAGRRMPNAERLSSCLVRLPLYFNMTDAEQDEVVGRAREFLSAL
jgi:dTDP-4-amino-4,6-dideoxygalactose transaminase